MLAEFLKAFSSLLSISPNTNPLDEANKLIERASADAKQQIEMPESPISSLKAPPFEQYSGGLNGDMRRIGKDVKAAIKKLSNNN
jgi:hypothetical protein